MAFLVKYKTQLGFVRLRFPGYNKIKTQLGYLRLRFIFYKNQKRNWALYNCVFNKSICQKKTQLGSVRLRLKRNWALSACV